MDKSHWHIFNEIDPDMKMSETSTSTNDIREWIDLPLNSGRNKDNMVVIRIKHDEMWIVLSF